MDQQTDLTAMLSLILQPAFCVSNGSITLCNKAAENLLIQKDTPISQLLDDHITEYEQFQGGCLLLSLNHNGLPLEASVTRVGDSDIFVIDANEAQPELNAYSLASATLRQPVSSVISLVRNLEPMLQETENPKAQEYCTRLKHHLWRIHRMLCNMSDVKYYEGGRSNHMVCQNITSVLEEVFQNAQALLQQCGIKLSYHIPHEDIPCLIDSQLLERGIYNMISNAIKFSGDSCTELKASLTCRSKRLYLSVEDNGCGINPGVLGGIFQRYTREPGLDSSPSGIGLGMALIRSAACVHKGTVLLDQPRDTGTRVTLSFPITLGRSAMVASGMTNIDYAGGWDHGLLELSDILPSSLYAST